MVSQRNVVKMVSLMKGEVTSESYWESKGALHELCARTSRDESSMQHR